jgi:16S rRNA processing protein RimM
VSTHWISYGIVARAHGVRGELRVVPLALDEPFPDGARTVRVSSKRGEERVLTVASVRPIHEALLLTVEEIGDRDAARELTGWSLEIDARVLPPPEDGELYVYELEGASVVDETGRALGKVTAMVDNHGQDLLEIDAGGSERLLPFVPETIVGFDRERRQLTVRPIPGLWEEDDD